MNLQRIEDYQLKFFNKIGFQSTWSNSHNFEATFERLFAERSDYLQ